VTLYAPFSNVGNVLYDADAMYINMKEIHFSKKEGEEEGADEPIRDRNVEGVSLVKVPSILLY
jgi:hypothetical protein